MRIPVSALSVMPMPTLLQKAHGVGHCGGSLHSSWFSAYSSGVQPGKSSAHLLGLAIPQVDFMCLPSGNSHEIYYQNIVEMNEVFYYICFRLIACCPILASSTSSSMPWLLNIRYRC